MRTLYIMGEESVETRYTSEWNVHIPSMFEDVLEKNKIKAQVVQVCGNDKDCDSVTPNEHNIWKSTQLINLLKNKISNGDVILYTDAWSPTILQVKYILSLQNINAKIVGIWHSGNYDPQDLLGRVLGDSAWIKETEKALFGAIDSNIFATEFHADMFVENLLDLHERKKEEFKHYCKLSVVVSGFPFEYLPQTLRNDVEDKSFEKGIKKDKIIFPHKIAYGKQPEIFKDLAKEMTDFEFVFCQDRNLTKKQYHTHMAESVLCWSANLQETFGIGMVEAAHLNTIPLCPNRLSYSEMYMDEFLYPSNWTKDFDSYQKNKANIIKKIRSLTKSYKKDPKEMLDLLSRQRVKLERFISSKNMIECVLNYLEG